MAQKIMAANERPPYYAIVHHAPVSDGIDAGQFIDAAEILIGLAAAEPGFLGIEEGLDDDGRTFTVCYWDAPTAIRRWRRDAAERIPARLTPDDVIGPTGCLWPWLEDVRQAQTRRESPFEVPYDTERQVA